MAFFSASDKVHLLFVLIPGPRGWRRDKVIDCLCILEHIELNETILQGYILYKEQRPPLIGPGGVAWPLLNTQNINAALNFLLHPSLDIQSVE